MATSVTNKNKHVNTRFLGQILTICLFAFGLLSSSKAATQSLNKMDFSVTSYQQAIFKADTQNLQVAYLNLPTEIWIDNTISLLSSQLELTDYIEQYPLVVSMATIKTKIVSDMTLFKYSQATAKGYQSTLKDAPEAYHAYIEEQLMLRNFQSRIINPVIDKESEILSMKKLKNLVQDIDFEVTSEYSFGVKLTDQQALKYIVNDNDWIMQFKEPMVARLEQNNSIINYEDEAQLSEAIYLPAVN